MREGNTEDPLEQQLPVPAFCLPHCSLLPLPCLVQDGDRSVRFLAVMNISRFLLFPSIYFLRLSAAHARSLTLVLIPLFLRLLYSSFFFLPSSTSHYGSPHFSWCHLFSFFFPCSSFFFTFLLLSFVHPLFPLGNCWGAHCTRGVENGEEWVRASTSSVGCDEDKQQ